jgi:hypothetical protein
LLASDLIRDGEKMTVNTIGQSSYASGLQQKQQNMNNLFAALKSGDMASAQKAYAASGMPPMAVNNTSPMGRLYQALRNEDLAGAQKAALDMQGKHGKATANASPANTKPATTPTTPAQTAAALAQASQKAQQSSLLAMLGRGTNVNTWG